MNDEKALDVLMAVYLIPDLAKDDFDALVKLADDGTVTINGVILVQKDAEGEIEVTDAGDQRGRRPKVARKVVRRLVGKKVGDELDEQLPPSSAGLVAVYDHSDTDAVDKALANAVKKSTSEIDKAGAKQLKEGLSEAGAGLSG
jgi:hypothetical protein